MKTVRYNKEKNINDIPNCLDEIKKDIQEGREVILTESNRITAKIMPISDSCDPVQWPDFSKRAVGIFGKTTESSAIQALTETREERF